MHGSSNMPINLQQQKACLYKIGRDTVNPMGQMSRKRDYDDAGLAADSLSSKRNRQSPPRIGGLQINGHQNDANTDLSSTVSEDSTSSASDSSSHISEGSIAPDTFPDGDEDGISSSGTSSSSSSPSSSSSGDASYTNPIGEEDNDEESGVVESSEVSEKGGSDSEKQVDSDSDSDSIAYVTGRPKPQFQRLNEPSLFSRVSSFLPKLRAANDELERQIRMGHAQDVIMDGANDGSQGKYIEMDLGLGVLEGKNSDVSSQEPDSCSEESSSDSDGRGMVNSAVTSHGHREPGVLDRLMGNKSRLKKPGIEEVEK